MKWSNSTLKLYLPVALDLCMELLPLPRMAAFSTSSPSITRSQVIYSLLSQFAMKLSQVPSSGTRMSMLWTIAGSSSPSA